MTAVTPKTTGEKKAVRSRRRSVTKTVPIRATNPTTATT
jgi:hypothetical protein